eukprot:410449-Ditylum_brightwellii.AAC.1
MASIQRTLCQRMQNTQSDANLTNMVTNNTMISPSKNVTTTTAGQNLDKTPVIPPKESPPKKTGKTSTITKHKLQITFLVGKNEGINLREKFGTLLLLLITHFPALTLEELGSTDADRAQSITTGANLPFENKTRLVTQWLITSQSTFYKIKNNSYMTGHLEKYRIFMNLTNVKANSPEFWGFLCSFMEHTATGRRCTKNSHFNLT